MRKIVSFLFLILTIALFFALIFANLAPLVNPENTFVFTLFGLAFPFIFVANAVTLLFWLYYKKKYLLLPLIALLLSYSNFKKSFAFAHPLKATEKQKPIKLMTWNVKNFELYSNKRGERRKQILKAIEQQAPQILSMQEFYSKDADTWDSKLYFKEVLKYPFSHFEPKLTIKNKHHYGIGIFSKFPIINKGEIPFYNSRLNSCVFADVVTEKDTLRIYNVHFASISFQKEDYEVASKLNQEIDIEGTKTILKKLKKAYQNRSEQTALVAKHIKNSPFKVILMGDFNDTPVSYTYSKFSNTLQDSFKEAAQGFGGTYNGPLPSFRIDYIFADTSINIFSHKVLKENLSDHYPIIVELE